MFEVHQSTSVIKRLFLLVVVAIAVVPRMPFDRPFTIGGDLSHRFRQLLIVIGILNLIKSTILVGLPKIDRLLIYALESILVSFLSLLTPYLLRTWLSDRVNFPGSRASGKGLVPWVYATIILSCAGVFLTVTFDNEDLWVTKKVSDVLTFIPVMRTMRIYNMVTTAGASYPGRGSVLSQTVMVIEYYCLLSQSGDILLKVASLAGFTDLVTNKKLIQGFNSHSHFAVYTRILGHAIFLNVLDETYHFHDVHTSSGDDHADSSCETNTYTQQSSNSMEIISTGPYKGRA